MAPDKDNRYLVSGSLDQVVRVWVPDRSLPLVSLFVAGNDWVTYPEDARQLRRLLDRLIVAA